MTNSKEQHKAEQARAELDTLHTLSAESLKRAIEPLWFRFFVSLSAGIMATMSALDVSRWFLLPLSLILMCIILYHNLKAGVIPRIYPKRVLIYGVLSFMALFMPIVWSLRNFSDQLSPWYAISLGIILTVSLFLLLRFEQKILHMKYKKLKEQ